jgi:hypothetical protein
LCSLFLIIKSEVPHLHVSKIQPVEHVSDIFQIDILFPEQNSKLLVETLDRVVLKFDWNALQHEYGQASFLCRLAPRENTSNAIAYHRNFEWIWLISRPEQNWNGSMVIFCIVGSANPLKDPCQAPFITATAPVELDLHVELLTAGRGRLSAATVTFVIVPSNSSTACIRNDVIGSSASAPCPTPQQPAEGSASDGAEHLAAADAAAALERYLAGGEGPPPPPASPASAPVRWSLYDPARMARRFPGEAWELDPQRWKSWWIPPLLLDSRLFRLDKTKE